MNYARFLSLLAGLLLALGASESHGAAIVISGEWGNGSTFSGQGALPASGDLWNGGASIAGAKDSLGAATAVRYVTTGGGFGSTNAGPSPYDSDLFRGYLHTSMSRLTIDNLPDVPMNLYLYGARDARDLFASNNEGAAFTVDGVTQTTISNKANWTQPYVEGLTHVRFANVRPNANGQLVIDVANNGVDARIVNGFQIEILAQPSNVVNVDFRNSSGAMFGQGAARDTGHNYWNTPGDANSASNLFDSTGLFASGVGYSLTGASVGGTAINGHENALTADYRHGTGMTLTLDGLALGQAYDLYLYGASDSRDAFAGDNRGATFSIAGYGSLESSGFLSDWTDTYVEGVTHVIFRGILPDANGEIVVGITGVGGSGTGILNGFQLVAVPEPASFALLGIGTLLILGVARRRR